MCFAEPFSTCWLWGPKPPPCATSHIAAATQHRCVYNQGLPFSQIFAFCSSAAIPRPGLLYPHKYEHPPNPIIPSILVAHNPATLLLLCLATCARQNLWNSCIHRVSSCYTLCVHTGSPCTAVCTARDPAALPCFCSMAHIYALWHSRPAACMYLSFSFIRRSVHLCSCVQSLKLNVVTSERLKNASETRHPYTCVVLLCPWYEVIFPSPLIRSQWTLCTVWDAEIKTSIFNELTSNNILKLSFSSVSPKFSLAILCIHLIRNMLFQSGHWHCRRSYCWKMTPNLRCLNPQLYMHRDVQLWNMHWPFKKLTKIQDLVGHFS